MSTKVQPIGPVDAGEVRSYLSELSQLLLSWSWEGVVGYEAMVLQAAKAFGYDNVTVIFGAEAATIELDGKISIAKIELRRHFDPENMRRQSKSPAHVNCVLVRHSARRLEMS